MGVVGMSIDDIVVVVQLRSHHRLILNLLNHAGRPVGARLREPAQVGRVEAQADDGVAAPALGLADAPVERVVAARVQHRREPRQLPARQRLDDHAQPRGDVARAHRQPVDGPQDLDDPVAGEVHHGGGDNAFCFGELWTPMLVTEHGVSVRYDLLTYTVKVRDLGRDVVILVLLMLCIFLLATETHDDWMVRFG